MRGAYCRERSADADAGAEPQRGFGVLDREVGLARPEPAHRALGPAAREARVERYGMIDQSRHGTDVLAKLGQSDGRIRARFPIIANELQRGIRSRFPSDDAWLDARSGRRELAGKRRSRPRRMPARNEDRERSPAPLDAGPLGSALPTTTRSHGPADTELTVVQGI